MSGSFLISLIISSKVSLLKLSKGEGSIFNDSFKISLFPFWIFSIVFTTVIPGIALMSDIMSVVFLLFEKAKVPSIV